MHACMWGKVYVQVHVYIGIYIYSMYCLFVYSFIDVCM